jgi:TonB-dependent SusC/RagA subfamily outer membrane receptor
MNRLSAPGVAAVAFCVGLQFACGHTTKPAGNAGEEPAPSGGAPREIVTAKDIENNPGQSIEQIIAQRFPGVMAVRTPDGGFALRIRGGSSIEGNNAPLYVIDGVPVDPGPYGSLTGINPRDIATIEVLKDAVSTSMYGMRGANGVIIIKTKKPPS